MVHQCKICGTYNCKKHTALVGRARTIKNFSGASPPEIFVGRYNYPNVYAGIVSPQEHGDTSKMSSHEHWHEKKMSIPEILSLRQQLILARDQTNIHKAKISEHESQKFLGTIQEVAMTHRSISAAYQLKKPIRVNNEKESRVPLMQSAAQVQSVTLEENPLIRPAVERIASDTEVKATVAMRELANAGLESTAIIKLLSAGLLGRKKNRTLVPTRWAITATDDTLSKEKMEKIKLYPEIQEICVFHAEYVGNHYEFLFLPEVFSFEVIEIAQRWSEPHTSIKPKPIPAGTSHDYETYEQRKKYADSVTGAYYANRLACTEHLEKIKRQAMCIVFREIRPEYSAPLGVGILRQISREALQQKPEVFETKKEAFTAIQARLRLPLEEFTQHSYLLKNYGKQTRMSEFL